MFHSTTISNIEAALNETFGHPTGEKIFHSASVNLKRLLEKENNFEKLVFEKHIAGHLFPAIAVYQALLAEGIGQQEALDIIRSELHQYAVRKMHDNQRLARQPFAYLMYRLFSPRILKYNFPSPYWKLNWKQLDKHCISWEFTQCVYADITKETGCPELCCLFCENDETAFSGLKPRILFSRSHTLADGFGVCDFQLHNGKSRK